MATIIFPLILKEHETGDLDFYEDGASLIAAVEPPEVNEGAYLVMDSAGRTGSLSVTKRPQPQFETIQLEWGRDLSEQPKSVEALLREYLELHRRSPGEGNDIRYLLKEARALSEAIRRESVPWYLRPWRGRTE